MVGIECKLCSKKFSNGKALGGHMRSHYATLPLPPKTPQRQEVREPLTGSTSSIFSCDERESSGDQRSSICVSHGLRENPKRSFRQLVDPKSFDDDRDSEFESTRGRCKMTKAGMSIEEPLSELKMEEDVALSLIMLSRDVWRISDALKIGKKIYKCERCDKVFKSSQGLGNHRAAKKIKNGPKIVVVVKEQVCPFCGKIFSSAQALGGHKRSHFLASKVGTSLVQQRTNKFEDAPIDLNLPAAMEVES